MKNTLAPLLVLNAFSGLNVAVSFTARPLAGVSPMRVSTPNVAPRHPIQLFDSPVTTQEEKATDKTEMAIETSTTNGDASVPPPAEEEEELSETKKLLQKVKQAGTAGAISYALWELGFWGISIPVCSVGYYKVAGHWPDFSNAEDMEKLGAEAFAFVNFARLAVPLRIGLALSTTPWIDENVVQKFMKKDSDKGGDSDE